MTTWRHVVLTFLSTFVGAIGFAVLAMFNLERFEALGIEPGWGFLGMFLVGGLIPRAIFRGLVPARCPECGGRAYMHGSRPIRYRCRDCDHVEKTFFYEGNRRRRLY